MASTLLPGGSAPRLLPVTFSTTASHSWTLSEGEFPFLTCP
jgi:hypothetical protein